MLTGAKTTKSPLLGRDSAIIFCGILGGSFYPGIRVLLRKTFTVYIRKHRGASFPLVLLGGHSSLLREKHFPRNSVAGVRAQSTHTHMNTHMHVCLCSFTITPFHTTSLEDSVVRQNFS